MKKLLLTILGVVILAIVLIALVGMYKFNYLANLPGYDANENKIETEEENGFGIIEVLGQSCQTDTDCETPMEYAILSRCPYDSVCLENVCTVICPHPFSGTPVPRE